MTKKSVTKLKKELDKIFSLYIRNRYAKNGSCKCVTCGVIKPINEMQAGHYVSRQHLAIRYDERNVHPQCVGCNVFKNGNMTAYAIFMLDTYGAEVMNELEKKKQEITKNYPYQEKIDFYTNELCKATNTKLIENLTDQIYRQTYDTIYRQIHNKIQNQIHNKNYIKISDRIKSQINNKLYDQIYIKIYGIYGPPRNLKNLWKI